MVLIYRSSVLQLVENMEDEKVDTIIKEVKNLISYIEDGENAETY